MAVIYTIKNIKNILQFEHLHHKICSLDSNLTSLIEMHSRWCFAIATTSARQPVRRAANEASDIIKIVTGLEFFEAT